MTYSIKSFQNKGDYRLIGLQSVESLDAFMSEVNKATRLWIDELQVFVTSEHMPSHSDYVPFKCEIDLLHSSRSSQLLVFYGKGLTLLASTIERVFCLPDSHQDRIIEFSGSGERHSNLIFSLEQLQSIFSAHESHTYLFYNLNMTPEQSVMLAAMTNLNGVNSCSISDKGQALVEYLEHGNGTRTLGTFSNQFDFSSSHAIVKFLCRSTYPVFEQFTNNQGYIFLDPFEDAMVAKVNVKSVMVMVYPYGYHEDDGIPLVRAIRDGTYVPQKLHLCFDTSHRDLDERIGHYDNALRHLFGAMSSPSCQLKELQLEIETAQLSSTVRIVEKHLIDMLKKNQSLETLLIDSSVAPLQFPAMAVLHAVVEHPRLRKFDFLPPYGCDPPKIDPSDLFQKWYRKNLSFSVQFGDGRSSRSFEGHLIDTKPHIDKWQDYLFFSRFELLQRVEDERTRSHLLVAALAKHSSSPQRVHFLLAGNQNVFAK